MPSDKIIGEAVGAKSYLGFTNTRGPANTQIQIPLMDKHDTGRRSHYLTVQFSVYDAPAVDELVVALGAATRGRPHSNNPENTAAGQSALILTQADIRY